MTNRNYISLAIWIILLISIGFTIGSLTKIEVNTWYETLIRSPLTPINYIFPVAWTILYIMIAICGWIIWRASSFPKLLSIKSLYIIQLILNWSWTPLFFHYHLAVYSLICLLIMDIIVATIIYLGRIRLKSVSLLMIPYLLWILFATYLNFYIWHYN